MAATLIDQSDRWLIVDTPFGADQAVLTAFDGEEALSQLFSYRLEIMSPDDSLEADKILGKKVGFSVYRANGAPRQFNGIVKSFHAGPKRDRGYRTYHAEVVPWTWFLTRTADCKIFQEMAVPDILKEVFAEYGFTDYELKLSGSHPKHGYRVQYRETDFDFISRLIEEEGIFYYFVHEKKKHVMVIADNKSAYYDLEEKEVECREAENSAGGITGFSHRYEFQTGMWTQKDYNFEKPATNLEVQQKTILKTPDAKKFEVYDYHGRYTDKGDGKALTKLRMEEEEAAYAVTDGNGTCRTFSPGGKFAISRHDIRAEVGKKYAVTSISHAATDYTSIYADAGPPSYNNSFTGIPDSVTFRPSQQTPRPTVRGPQTAVVVGSSGEEIDCDEYGRVKVQFHWDRLGENNEKSSCWVRVAQLMAGNGWGALFTPRIGMEVVVDFLEGDPDQPIVTGTVYNGTNAVPYDLPANATQSGFKSKSSKDGGKEDFNELRFEDKKDAEEIYFHAQKDFTRHVENHDRLTVGGDQEITLTGESDEDGHRTVTLDTGDDTLAITEGKRETTIKNDDVLTITDGNCETTVDMGDLTTTVSAGKAVMEAATSIELKVGGSSIKIEPACITLKSTQVKIKADAQFEAKGAMAKVEGSGMLTLKGGVVMIN